MECKTLPISGVDIAHFDRLLLTANRRLANYHQHRFNLKQIEQNKSSWKNPQIAPLKSWLTHLWHDHCQSSELLLSDLQEQELWQSIIEESQPLLLDVKTSASLAKSAYETLKLWQCSLSELRGASNEQVAQFVEWACRFEKICDQGHWRNYGQIVNALVEKIADIPRPQSIYLDGFDDFPPAYQKILSSLHAKIQNETVEKFEAASNIQKILLADSENEMWSMARWAKNQVEQNPHMNIGCIVPNLTENRDRLETIFTTIFSPNNMLVTRTETRHFFNLSAGANLTSYDIIRVAKSVLNLVEEECDLEKLGALLQSPYLGLNEYDLSQGAQYHANLLALGAESLPLRSIWTLLSPYFEDKSQSTWLPRLRNFLDLCKPLSPRSPQEWTIFFSQLLEAMAWPGQRTLDSQDYQLCARFKQSLSEFSALDVIYPRLTFKKARQIFNDLLSRTIFQAQSVPANIQILGTLESAGFHFDAIWIMGLHDEAWPQAAKPNPFLPYEFQKKNNMPHASPSRELSYAKQVLQRLLQSAPHIILSVPLRDGDKVLQASALIDFVPISETILSQSEEKELAHPARVEFMDDELAPPLSPKENIRGGSWIIKQQAICPFRAFASIRLNTKALPEPSLGLSPSERGILLHRCLEKIWSLLRDQPTLLAKSQADVQALISKVCSSTIEHFENKNPKPQEKFLKTEKIRLEKLLFQFLEFEKNRSPFSVAAIERSFQVSIGELNLEIRVDRIDRLDNGQYLIIDYKTGACSINDWLGPRPQDPQLPLYCSFTRLDNQEYSGISFAELKAEKLQFKGLIAGEDKAEETVPGVINTSAWESYLHQWRHSILQLSQEFSSGDARVAPDNIHSCEYCDLQPLCRVNS